MDPKITADKQYILQKKKFLTIRQSYDKRTINIYILNMHLNPRSLEGGQIDPPPSIFLALNFCSLTDCQKLWHNCSLFVNTSFDTN